MASTFFKSKPAKSLAPDLFERVLALAPRVWLTGRAHNVAGYRGTVRGLVTGGLVVAGYFTLIETRLLGHWLFG